MLDEVLRLRRPWARRRPSPGAARRSSSAPGADELIVAAQIFDHAARLRSFEIAAEAREALSG